jgi:hypothetical protein
VVQRTDNGAQGVKQKNEKGFPRCLKIKEIDWWIKKTRVKIGGKFGLIN